jgi:dTDP-4-dehydrorhamnose 3,5-epimerase
MRLAPTTVPGAFVVELEPAVDERGWFARTFDAEEFAAHGLEAGIAQCSTSFNARAGTLRGLHHQVAPHEECKLVRCTRGRLYDVVLDLRPESLGEWFGVELTPDNSLSVYVPPGCAHGFQTLEDSTEVSYQISTPHAPDAARGVRWNDPRFGLDWPDPPPGGERIVSARDAGWPDWKP